MSLSKNPLPTLADEIMAALPALLKSHPTGPTLQNLVTHLGSDVRSIREACKELNIQARANLMRRRHSREMYLLPIRCRHDDGLRICIHCAAAFEQLRWKRGKRVDYSARRTCSRRCWATVGALKRNAISQDIITKCISLRLEKQLSTPAIARKVGICNHSVYRFLKDYPWNPTDKRAHYVSRWKSTENAILKRLWRTAEEDQIAAALPKRTRAAIEKHAAALGLRRPMPGARKNTRPIHPLIMRLVQIRERRRIKRSDLSKACGYHINCILGWELGKTQPKLRHLDAWAKALGFEIGISESVTDHQLKLAA